MMVTLVELIRLVISFSPTILMIIKFNDTISGDYVNSKEYRKPEWVTRMEEIQKRLAGK